MTNILKQTLIMKSANIQKLQNMGLRLMLCAGALCVGSQAYAQSAFEDDMHIAGPKHKHVIKDTYKKVSVHGTIVDQATKKPLSGVLCTYVR
jgi:hypothetical protein